MRNGLFDLALSAPFDKIGEHPSFGPFFVYGQKDRIDNIRFSCFEKHDSRFFLDLDIFIFFKDCQKTLFFLLCLRNKFIQYLRQKMDLLLFDHLLLDLLESDLIDISQDSEKVTEMGDVSAADSFKDD